MPPCQHTEAVAGCRVCHLFATRPDYRRLWGGDPAGVLNPQPEVSARVPLPLCEHLGVGTGCVTRKCGKGHGGLRGVKPCDSCGPVCPDYSPEDGGCPAPDTFVFEPKPGDPAVGVVLGSFRWPALIDLQCRVIRANCGPVPILVSNDDPESHGKLADICASHPDVTLDTNPERIGHTGGDIAAFHKGVIWGASRGLPVVAKLSQRFVIDRPRWLQDGARDLLRSGLALACRRCRGMETYDLRTEGVLMDIGWWNDPHVLSRIAPRRYWTDSPRGMAAETVIFRALQDMMGGIFWPWASMMGECRYRRDFHDVLWHCNTPSSEYRLLANRHGMRLPPEFHCDGWQHELKKGTYLYG